jgi:hypothetical protein
MTENIVARRILLGAGALALAMPPSKADAAALNITSVKTFGAIGNGSADDTKAIQRAVNWTSAANRGTIFFPLGTYRITAPITFETPSLHIAFVGEPGALIAGNFADALLKRSVRSPISGVHVIENLRFINSHASGKGVMLHSCVTGKIVNCQFGVVGVAVEVFNSQCLTVDTCNIIGSKVGIMAGNATMVLDCDITGCTHGIRHQNVGLTVHGGRYEVNKVAIKVGYDQLDRGHQSSGFDISGLSMEANQTSIQIGAGASGKISACSIGGGVSMAYGLDLISPQDVLVAGVSVAGSRGFTGAGIRIVSPTRTVLMGVGSYSPRAWMLPADQRQLSFIQTNKS